MDSLQRAFNRFRSFFRKEELDQDLDAELKSHLDLAIEENLSTGMSAGEARRQALIRFGGVEQAKEQQREARGLPSLDVLLQDLRYTFRALRRDSVFTCIAVLILALGIGANIAVFSVVNTILLRPLPFHNAEKLVWISASKEGAGGLSSATYSADAYDQLMAQNHSFQDVTGYFAFSTDNNFRLTGRGEPLPVSGISVVGNFFHTLGVEPLLGRLFTADECQKGGRPAVLLSEPFWRREFAADPAIVGKAVSLNGQPVTVVGVLPATFDFGSVFAPGLKVDLIVPLVMDDIREWGNTLALIGRLKPGVTVGQAQAEADPLFPRFLFSRKHPEYGGGYTGTLATLKDHVSGKLHRSLVVLWCAVGLILLIVCVNLSNLLLARAASRRKEFALRSALGAGRGRLVRQLLTESFVLSGFGAIFGLGLAYTLTYYLAHQGSMALPLLSSVSVDRTALVWTLIITVGASVLFGLVPALKMSGDNLQEALKDAGQGMSEGRKHERLRSVLVISEVALACVLLTGAGLLLRSFLHVLDVDLGFQPSRAAALRVDYDDGGKDEKRSAILQEMLKRVEAIPGIEAAGVTDNLPLDRNRGWGLTAKGNEYRKDENKPALVYVVTPGYLKAMGMHLREGRDFGWSDGPKSDPVIILNETAARQLWPGQDAIGRTAVVNARDTRVIGVISDVHEDSVEGEAGWQMYLSAAQFGPDGAELVVRTRLQPDVLASSVMSTLVRMNPNQPATEFRPIQQFVDHAVSPRRFFVLLVSAFAIFGLVLASLGIYGVISYSVIRQTQEIGIRMALGATATRVQRDVIFKTLRLASLGIVLGTVASFGVALWIESLLYGTAATDPATFIGMVLLLGFVAFIAGYFPARRASRINPMVALRSN